MVAPEGKARFAQPFSDYEILERIGSGAMGTVFRARQKKLDRIVAIKVLKPGLSRNARYVDRLIREAQIVARLNHPKIVKGYDLGQEGGYHFFVMEFVGGRSLRDLLREWGRFPEEQALSVGIQIGRALEHAFKHGVIHRDIKPGNILIDEEGNAKLTDLGLAKGPEDASLTSDGATVGTPHYISPEQARDPSAADVRSDLYSLGATLYHMVTGAPPFQGESLAQVIEKVLYHKAESAGRLNVNLSDGLILVIRKLMAKDPALRYQDPSELLADLERLERSELPKINPRDLERRGLPQKLAVGLALAAAVLVAAAAAFWPRAPVAPEPDGLRRKAFEQLGAELAQQSDPIKKLAMIEAFEPSGAAEKDELGAIRGRVADALRDDLRTFLDDLSRTFTDWVKENPRPASEWLEAHVPRRIADRFGVGPEALPARVADVYRTWRRGEAEVAPRRLDEIFARSEAEYLDFLEQSVRPLARRRNYAQALLAMDEYLRRYASEADLPPPDRFPAAFGDRVAALAAKRAAILAEPVRAAQAAAAEMEEDLAAWLKDLESMRTKHDPRESLKEVAGLRARFEERHPPPENFPDSVTPPWGKVHDAFARYEALFGSDLRELEKKEAANVLEGALWHLREHHDAESARKILSSTTPATPEVARDLEAWKTLVDALSRAEAWMQRVLKLDEPAFRKLAASAAAAGATRADQKNAPEHRAGVAFFLFLGDELNQALQHLPEDASESERLLKERIALKSSEMTEDNGRTDKEIQALLGQAQGMLSAGSAAEAFKIAENIASRFASRKTLYTKYKSRIEVLQSSALLAQQEDTKKSAILKSLPKGAVADVTSSGQVLVRIETAKLDGANLPAGFELSEGSRALRRTKAQADVALTLASPFVLPSCVSVEKTATAVVGFGIPEGPLPPLLLVSFHGYHAAVAAPGKGHALGAVFKDPMLTLDTVTKHLLGAMRSEVPAESVRLVPGARYKLTLTVDVNARKRTRVTLKLDDAVIAFEEWTGEPRRDQGEIAFRLFGPFDVTSLELRGEAL